MLPNERFNKSKKFYVTTPIYYVTAKPHLGSLYSTLLADIAARWHKLKGYKTFFLTGTDEHGQKVAEAAFKEHMEPQDFVDSFINDFKQTWYDYNISYDYFIRTTDESHVKAVQAWIKRLKENGDIYKSYYTGFYCTPCETFITEKDQEDSKKTPDCTSCNRQTSLVSEESYFFKLSSYQDKLLKFYEENPEFVVPNERLNEVISFVKQGLKDLSISRTTVKWGIPFPDDSNHVTYVWADALNNYITAIGYANPSREDEFNFWWPADLQILGKDILRFHAIYWPAFLMASDLQIPKKLLVHGWIRINNQKMSKSLGNVIDPKILLDKYGADSIRYYLTRYMAITQDSEFSIQDLEHRINSDLANDLGNLLNRMVTLAQKKDLFEIKAPQNWGIKALALRDAFWDCLEIFECEMEEGYFYKALAILAKFVSQVNAYFHAQEPWREKDLLKFEEVISATSHSLYCVAILLWPVMPNKMTELLRSLGLNFELKEGQDLITELDDNPWNKTFILNKIDNLFQKIEIQKEEMGPDPKQQERSDQCAMSQPSRAQCPLVKPSLDNDSVVQHHQVSEEPEPEVSNITIQDFSNVMLLVGTIESCEEVKGSDKLYKLTVNFGSYGIRQVLSGIKRQFFPEQLVSKQAIFVYNLEPRKMMGLESQGMILTATGFDKALHLVSIGTLVPNGTRLK